MASIPVAAGEGGERQTYLQIRLGIPIEIQLYEPDGEEAKQFIAASEVVTAAYDRAKQLDRVFSDYDPDSEVRRLSSDSAKSQLLGPAGLGPRPVSRDLWAVLQASRRVHTETDGAFDCGLGRLTHLWRKARRFRRMPDRDELTAALASSGQTNITFDEANQAVTLSDGLRLDFGGIAKGYVLDEMARVLKKHNVTRFLIDAGGDLIAGDPPPGRTAWRVGIAPAKDANGEPTVFLPLVNAAVATSGDSVQFVEIEGQRYSHILNPRTGLGLTTRSSVSVLAADAMTADAWASAISVMGPDRGVRAAESKDGLQARVEWDDGGPSPRTATTTGWPGEENEIGQTDHVPAGD